MYPEQKELRRDVMTIENAQQYLAKGFPIIPVPHGTKAPVHKDWNNLSITNENVAKYFSDAPQNVSVLLGKENSKLMGLDLDCPGARYFAGLFAPETGYIYGRKSNPESHWIYTVTDDEMTPMQFSHTQHGMLLELRGKGQASILPGSTHTEGELYEVVKDDLPAAVVYNDLYRAVALVAVCTLYALDYPVKGNRQNVALAVAGTLCKAGYPDNAVISAVYHVAKYVKDEEAGSRRQAAEDTVKKYRAGSPIIGFMGLKEQFSEITVNMFTKWLRFSETAEVDELIERFNQQYAYMVLGGNPRIVVFGFNYGTGEAEIDFMKLDAFKGLYRKDKICIGQSKRGPLYKSFAEVWLDHPDRRTYHNMVFLPGKTVPPTVYNYFQGFGLKPDETSSCQLFLDHLLRVVCKENEAIYLWVLAWLADIVQNPGAKAGTAIVLRGLQGTGKSIVGEYFGRIVKPHFLQVNNSRHLLGNFNAHQYGAIFALCDEAFWAGEKSGEGVLKDIITSHTMNIERKGVDVIKVPNCIRLLITSNNAWVVPAAGDDRRFLVLDVAEDVIQDHEYFSKLHEEMQNGGPAALLHYLLGYDCSGLNLRKPPQTEALIEQKIETLDAVGKCLYICLARGHIHPKGKFWPEQIEVEQFFDFCYEETKKARMLERSLQTKLGIGLKKYLGDIKKAKMILQGVDLETGVPYDTVVGLNKFQQTVYVLPSLEECRKRFTQNTGIPFVPEPPREE